MLSKIVPVLLAITSPVFAATPPPLVVHEWGTFTSMVGSDGKRLTGMHHEEVGLPGFVYNLGKEQTGLSLLDHGQGCKGHRCADVPLSFHEVIPGTPFDFGVTQKMETPVLYFYGAEGTQVHVSVDFPQGAISQWYPRASRFVQHTRLNAGGIDWNATLMKPDSGGLPRTLSTSIWNPAREVPEANVLSVGAERERFLFYRGLADFELPIEVALDQENGPAITYSYRDPALPEVSGFFVDVKPGGQVQWTAVTFPKGASRRLISKVAVDTGSQGIGAALVSELARAGLTGPEARAMVKTWNASYFKTSGPRLLLLMPRAWTDQILPIRITPTPSELSRVLVARVELLGRGDEQKVLDSVSAGASDSEPKLRRALMLTKEPKIQARLRELIESAR